MLFTIRGRRARLLAFAISFSAASYLLACLVLSDYRPSIPRLSSMEMRDKAVVIASLERDNTTWVSEYLPEYACYALIFVISKLIKLQLATIHLHRRCLQSLRLQVHNCHE